METAFIMFCDIISCIDTIEKGQVTLDRSSEFCLKPLIYLYILKTDHAPGETLVGPFLPPEL